MFVSSSSDLLDHRHLQGPCHLDSAPTYTSNSSFTEDQADVQRGRGTFRPLLGDSGGRLVAASLSWYFSWDWGLCAVTSQLSQEAFVDMGSSFWAEGFVTGSPHCWRRPLSIRCRPGTNRILTSKRASASYKKSPPLLAPKVEFLGCLLSWP